MCTCGITGSMETGGLLTNSGFNGSIVVFTSNATVVPFVGGIIGKGSIENCYAKGEISLQCNIGESYVNSNSLGVPCRVGGLVGDGAATECYAEIEVKGEYTTLYDQAQNPLYVGGLVGTGNVLNSYSVGTVTYFYGHFYCIGIIGCSIDIIMPASKILRYFTCVSKPSNTGFMLSNVKISLARKAA